MNIRGKFFRATALALYFAMLALAPANIAAGEGGAKAARPAAAAKARKLILQIHYVHCKDETTGEHREKFWKDHIVMSTITLAPSGTAVKTPLLDVGFFEKDGDLIPVKDSEGAPRAVATFDISADPKDFPALFQAWIVLAETDPGGGFNKQLDTFVSRINQGLKPFKKQSLLDDAKSAATKGGANTVTGGEPTLQRMAAEVGKEFLKMQAEKWAKDDVFPPAAVKLRIPKPDFKFAKGAAGPREFVILEGLQGKYVVGYSWRIGS